MSKTKNAKLKAVEKDMLIEEAIHAQACAVPTASAPTLRYFVTKPGTFFSKGEKVLQYKDGDRWIDCAKVPTATA